MEKIVSELNLVVRGWRNYFSLGNSTNQLQALDHYLFSECAGRFWRIIKELGDARSGRISRLGLRAGEWSTST